MLASLTCRLFGHTISPGRSGIPPHLHVRQSPEAPAGRIIADVGHDRARLYGICRRCGADFHVASLYPSSRNEEHAEPRRSFPRIPDLEWTETAYRDGLRSWRARSLFGTHLVCEFRTADRSGTEYHRIGQADPDRRFPSFAEAAAAVQADVRRRIEEGLFLPFSRQAPIGHDSTMPRVGAGSPAAPAYIRNR